MSTKRILAALAIAVIMPLAVFAAKKEAAHKLPRPEISAKMPYPSRYISVLGSKMHYVEAGQGDPILFLHGQPTSSYLWRNIMPYLEGQGRVIAVDNIGFGKSDKPNLTYDYAVSVRARRPSSFSRV